MDSFKLGQFFKNRFGIWTGTGVPNEGFGGKKLRDK